MSVQVTTQRLNLRQLRAMKKQKRIAMLTAYDVVTAQCLDEAGVDVLLVGDSMGNVVYGFESTHPVTMDMMLAHTAAVVRGSKRAFVIADLPFLSYQVSVEKAVENAGLCVARAGAHGVKLEGASAYTLGVIERIVDAGIPVIGHVGLRPQAVHQMGGYYTHGKNDESAEQLFNEAKALEKAGAFAVVLECVQKEVAQRISQELNILTIGIGSGAVCDGEVLVVNDILGFTPGAAPKFATVYANLKAEVTKAAKAFVDDTRGQALYQEITQ